MKSEGTDTEPGRGEQPSWGMLLIFAAFSVVGVALLIGGDPGGRVIGLIALILFGGGGLVYWGLTASRRSNRPPEVEEPHGDHVVYRSSTANAALASAGSVIFIVVGVAMISVPEFVSARIFPPALVIAVGAVAVLVFGLFLVGGIARLIRPGTLTLTPARIAYDVGLERFSGQWSDIEAVQKVGNDTLGIRATEGRLLHLRGQLRLLSPVHLRFWGVHVALPLKALRADPATVEAAVVDFHQSAGG